MGEIRPTNTAPVLMLEDDRLTPYPVSWGFPKWSGKGVNINARTDTVLNALEHPEKRSTWRNPILTRRCVVPSTGYYEWRSVEGSRKKEKYHLLEPDKGVLYMAGMIDTFTRPNGERYEAFAILTTAANESVSPLHDRMPVILQSNELEAWLWDEAFMRIVLNRICPVLIMTPVAENVNIQTSLF